MGARELIQSIQGRFRRKEQLPDEVAAEFLQVLEKIRLENFSCDEAFTQLDQYVQREVDGKNAARLMPLLREHLDCCTDCCDEYEALLKILAKSTVDR